MSVIYQHNRERRTFLRLLEPNSYARPLRNFTLLLSAPIIELWEQAYYKDFGLSQLRWPPVFIVGAPRTGSTILYQALTNNYKLTYISNLTCRFFRNLFFGVWLSNRVYGMKAHNVFRSEFGSTRLLGANAPSECGQFWYQWFPRDRHFLDTNDISRADMLRVRTIITSIVNYFNQPILFKNLNAGQRLRVLSQILPESKIVFLRRDPFFTAQSILKARRENKVPLGRWWSIMPRNKNELCTLPETDMVVNQIYYLEKQIAMDLGLFPREQVLVTNYEFLCKRPQPALEQVRSFIHPTLDTRSDYKCPEIKCSNSMRLDKDEEIRLRKLVSSLDWRLEAMRS